METRALPATLEVRETDAGRTLVGLVVPYGVQTRIGRYLEEFAKGAFTEATDDPAAVKLLASHDHENLPIGRALALAEHDHGLTGSFLVSDTQAGRDVLTLVRDGVATGLSVGFVPEVDAWNEDRTQVLRTRARLVEVSVVAWPAYPDAGIEAVRQLAGFRPVAPLLRLALRRR